MMMNSSYPSPDATLGVRFRPSDEELIRYLTMFVCGMPFECNHIRKNVDLYGNEKPCDLFDEIFPEGDPTDVNYFFAQLKKKSPHGRNVNRTLVCGGSWKGVDGGKRITNIKGKLIGFKKTFRFRGKNSDESIEWRMKEYCFTDDILMKLREDGRIRQEDFVLCRIKRKLVDHDDEYYQKEGSSAIISDRTENIGLYSLHEKQVDLCSNNCDPEVPVEFISSSAVVKQPTMQLGGCVQDGNRYMDYSCVPTSSFEDNNYEEIITNSRSSDLANVASEQPIWCLEDQNSIHIDSCAAPMTNSAVVDDQLEFERGKANVPSVEESMAELSNLLNGNDAESESCRNLLSSLFTSSEESNTSNIVDDPMSFQMPDLADTEGGGDFSAFVQEITTRSINEDQYSFGVASTDLYNYPASSTGDVLSVNLPRPTYHFGR